MQSRGETKKHLTLTKRSVLLPVAKEMAKANTWKGHSQKSCRGSNEMTRRKHWKFASEKEAREHIQQNRWDQNGPICTHCLKANFAELSYGKYRCKICGRRFSDFSRTWMEIPRLSHRQWLVLVDMFVRRHSAKQIAEELGGSYKSALKGLNAIRLAILDNDPYFRTSSFMWQWKFFLISKHDPGGCLGVPEDKPGGKHNVYDLSDSKHLRMRIGGSIDDIMDSGDQFVSVSGEFLFLDASDDECNTPATIVFACDKNLRWQHHKKILDHIDLPGWKPKSDFARYVFDRLIEHGHISSFWFPAYLAQFSFEFRNQGRGKAETILKYLCQNPLLNWHYLRKLRHDQTVLRALRAIYPWKTLSILLGTDHPEPIRISWVYRHEMPNPNFTELFECESYTQGFGEALKQTAPKEVQAVQ